MIYVLFLNILWVCLFAGGCAFGALYHREPKYARARRLGFRIGEYTLWLAGGAVLGEVLEILFFVFKGVPLP